LPEGLHVRDLVVAGIAAAIGFTVSSFFATAAFPRGPALAETKMGALLVTRVERRESLDDREASARIDDLMAVRNFAVS
jgi:hypothetical protein